MSVKINNHGNNPSRHDGDVDIFWITIATMEVLSRDGGPGGKGGGWRTDCGLWMEDNRLIWECIRCWSSDGDDAVVVDLDDVCCALCVAILWCLAHSIIILHTCYNNLYLFLCTKFLNIDRVLLSQPQTIHIYSTYYFFIRDNLKQNVYYIIQTFCSTVLHYSNLLFQTEYGMFWLIWTTIVQ